MYIHMCIFMYTFVNTYTIYVYIYLLGEDTFTFPQSSSNSPVNSEKNAVASVVENDEEGAIQ